MINTRVSTRIYSAPASLCVLLAAMLLAPPGYTREAEKASTADGFVIEEVFVTARKKEESLQDTPIAVTAMGTEALEKLGITNISNLKDSVPGLMLTTGNGASGASQIFIRGVGQKENKATLDPAVAVYVDDVYIGRPDGALMDIIDIASVQVLRGPQGTLFGRNATGGAMVLTTKKPEDEFSAMGMLRIGNYKRRDAQFTVNVPFSDTFAARLSVATINRDGFTKNIATGTEHDLQDRQSAYLRLRWWPSDTSTFDLNINWSRQDERGQGQSCSADENEPIQEVALLARAIIGDENSGIGGFLNNVPTTGSTLADIQNWINSASLFPAPFNVPYYEECNGDRELWDKREFRNSFDGIYKVTIRGAAGIYTHDFERWGSATNLQFKSVTAYRYVSATEASDIDGSNVVMGDREVFHPRETDQWSQELQLLGSLLDERLDFSVGLFYWQEGTDNGIENVRIGDPFTFQIFGPDSPFDAFRADTPVKVDAILAADDLAARTTDNESLAAYSQWTYRLSENWEFTAGLRYTKEIRSLEAIRLQNAIPPFYDASTPPSGFGFYSPAPGIIVAQPAGLPFFAALTPNGLNGLNLDDFYYDTLELLQKGYAAPQRAITSFEAWTPMLNISHFFYDDWLQALNADSVMSYLTYSEGFRAGGIVSGRTKWGRPPQHDPGHPVFYSSLEDFDPEEAINLEFGLKMEMFERRVRLNMAIYHMDYTNQQTTEPRKEVELGLIPDVVISNIGESTIQGAELELTALLTERMDVQFNIAHTDASFDKYNAISYSNCGSPGSNVVIPPYGEVYCGGGAIFEHHLDRSDEDMPGVPPWTVFFAVQYRFFWPLGIITPRFEAAYSRAIPAHFDRKSWNLGNWVIPEQTLYNARLTFDFINEKTRLALYGRNLTDELTVYGGIPNPESFGGGGATFSPPRTYGMELIHNF